MDFGGCWRGFTCRKGTGQVCVWYTQVCTRVQVKENVKRTHYPGRVSIPVQNHVAKLYYHVCLYTYTPRVWWYMYHITTILSFLPLPPSPSHLFLPKRTSFQSSFHQAFHLVHRLFSCQDLCNFVRTKTTGFPFDLPRYFFLVRIFFRSRSAIALRRCLVFYHLWFFQGPHF